jgi:transposase
LIGTLQTSGLEPAVTLAKTLSDWTEEIVRMWRFSPNNGITEGFHRKMKLIQRRAYGFRSFHNYRLRVIAQCG